MGDCEERMKDAGCAIADRQKSYLPSQIRTAGNSSQQLNKP